MTESNKAKWKVLRPFLVFHKNTTTEIRRTYLCTLEEED